MYKYLILFVLAFLGQGCTALHIPQSEIVVFEEIATGQRDKKDISLSSSIISNKLSPYAKELLGSDEEIVNRNLYGISIKRSFSIDKNNAIGIAIGSGGLGLDYSSSFFDKLYLTLSGNASLHYEAILQAPVLRDARSGLGMGVFYRNEQHGVQIQTTAQGVDYLFEQGQRFRVSAFGIRMNLYGVGRRGKAVRMRASVGYSPELEEVVLIAGLSL